MAMPRINVEDAREIPVPVPPVAEQVAIAELVGRFEEWRRAVAGKATTAASQLGSFDQAVLAKAFRGELVPQDPNDEPASVLLARIRSERETPPAGGGRGRPSPTGRTARDGVRARRE